jgi:hypothetical protein
LQANYERIAGAFGCQGYLASSIEEVKKSVQSALAEKTRPSIINVFIEPSAGRVEQVCLFSFRIQFILSIYFILGTCLADSLENINGFRLD